ncbi:hypothetical protein AC629_17775 [Bradyrhizobium sp. NAS80.1]|uniref:glycosyltransferase n=1 Tax=Bradyrhizobium sp. NAS80.1 TaxID=1680159 RepID=UPI00095A51C3|nr:hypothetical protein [Bradyrhizobium sp. NAS80.1]OKO86060.1 hypothetical protein AC629_17775 [Bradyrhizobium sp. NAS80.1]
MTGSVDGNNGLCFSPGDAEDLAAKVRCLLVDASAQKRMRREARETFDRNFTAEANHEALMAIYARAIDGYLRRDLREMDALPAS